VQKTRCNRCARDNDLKCYYTRTRIAHNYLSKHGAECLKFHFYVVAFQQHTQDLERSDKVA
jgi:hypothetical protein